MCVCRRTAAIVLFDCVQRNTFVCCVGMGVKFVLQFGRVHISSHYLCSPEQLQASERERALNQEMEERLKQILRGLVSALSLCISHATVFHSRGE